MTSDCGSVPSMCGIPSKQIDDPLRRSRPGENDPYGVELVSQPLPAVGFLTDATICIGCKACEVACKQWNQLPADSQTTRFEMTGFSYDNTVDLGATTWRHVAFVERPSRDGIAWLMLSDVCKHCVHAGCLDACPTGAIIRTEFGGVVIQDDVCNGCGYCVPACPFGVPQLSDADGGSHKCTLCYDRLRGGLAPACATACPTGSIRFGAVEELRGAGRERVATLKAQGLDDARLYGDDELGGSGGIGGLNAMFVLNGPPDAFNLPARPRLPRLNIVPSAAATFVAAAGYCLVAAFSFRRRV
jgi:formate dehydrogenase iron-sulfur subunit